MSTSSNMNFLRFFVDVYIFCLCEESFTRAVFGVFIIDQGFMSMWRRPKKWDILPCMQWNHVTKIKSNRQVTGEQEQVGNTDQGELSRSFDQTARVTVTAPKSLRGAQRHPMGRNRRTKKKHQTSDSDFALIGKEFWEGEEILSPWKIVQKWSYDKICCSIRGQEANMYKQRSGATRDWFGDASGTRLPILQLLAHVQTPSTAHALFQNQ